MKHMANPNRKTQGEYLSTYTMFRSRAANYINDRHKGSQFAFVSIDTEMAAVLMQGSF